MGYTHYFSRTVSLSEEQAAQFCENAAKIVTYWFDHTRNSAEIFARKEKHSGSWDEFLDSSHNQLKILESVDNREEKLVLPLIVRHTNIQNCKFQPLTRHNISLS